MTRLAELQSFPRKTDPLRQRTGIRLEPLLLENFAKQNITVYHLTDAERDAFKAATRSAWDDRMANASPLGKKLFNAILEAKKAQ